MRAELHKVIASTLKNIGVSVVTHVPGYGGSEVFTSVKEVYMKNFFTSFNEETAYTVCHGASIAGKRSACLIKTHGMLKAANSVSDSLYTDINAGFITFLFDDRTGKHSDTILEIRPFLEGLSIPYVICDLKNIYRQIVDTYNESERRKLPYVILIDTADISKECEYEETVYQPRPFQYQKNINRQIVSPLLAEFQYKLFTVKKFAGDYSSIVSQPLPMVPESVSSRQKEETIRYKDFFDVFKEYRNDFICGDTSLSSNYAFPPYNCIDIVTFMGGSVPLAVGAWLAGMKRVWALSGDFGFIAAGHLGLFEVIHREIPLKLVIFNNKKAAATGNQPIDKKIITRILCSQEKNILHITDPHNPFEISRILQEASSLNEFTIILVDY